MKRILLLLLIAFSVNAVAQLPQMFRTAKQPVKTPMEVIKSFPKKPTWKIPGVLTSEKILDFYKAKLQIAAQTDLQDSVRYWNWDADLQKWVNSEKTIKITYDARNRLISSINQQWDTDIEEWVNEGRTTYTYNTSDQTTEMLMEDWGESGWENSMRLRTTYDSNKNMTAFITEVWYESAWVVFMQTAYTYDGNNRVLTITDQIGFDAWGNFVPPVNVSRDMFTYNTAGDVLTLTEQNWETGSWINQLYTENTYDSNSHLTTCLKKYWEAGVWKNGTYEQYTYHSNKYLSTYIYQVWNSGAWLNTQKESYTYDSNDNNTNYLIQKWSGSAWENGSQSTFTYDSHGNQLMEIYQEWTSGAWLDKSRVTRSFNSNDDTLSEWYQNWTDNAWVSTGRYSYEYDSNFNEVRMSDEIWQNMKWNLFNLNTHKYNSNNSETEISDKTFDLDSQAVTTGDSIRFYYHSVPDGLDEQNDIHLKIYPNPAKEKFTITSDEDMTAVEIVNTQGAIVKMVALPEMVRSKSINISGFTDGLYLIRIHTGNNTYTKKLLLQ